MTLSQVAFGPASTIRNVALVLGGAAVIALAAQASIGWPVAMTLQTLAVLTIGFAYGARLGAATVVTYLGLGAMGLPVFSNGMNFLAFAGPTAGFLVGFVGMAYLAGLAADRGLRNVLGVALVGLVASMLLYVPGLAWAMGADAVFGLDTSKWGADSLASIWAYYMAPFLIGDAIKAVLAALIVSGGWSLMSRKA